MKTIFISAVQFLSDFVYLYPLLMSFVWMIGGLIFFWKLERKQKTPPELGNYPFFSVLVPCHNEEDQIEDTVSYLLELDYPEYEIILIDDGSSDDTEAIIHELSSKHEKVRAVYMKENVGKSDALNAGCLASKGELVLSIDADALLDKDCLKWLALHFIKYPRVGAVTGNPRVLNRTTLLGKIQTGEYATIIGLIKRSQRILGKVLTVSGVVAAFRKKALAAAGFWDSHMVTEDIDITWKLEKKFWDVRYEPRAVCWVLVPETIRGLLQQRIRWAQGGIEVLKKHDKIWQDWRQRRLWPVYVEYAFSVLWVFSFWALILMWLTQITFYGGLPVKMLPPLPPLWTGSILALVCILQFSVSIFIDNHYDKKMFRYLFWVIWYPFVYWVINAVSLMIAIPKALMGIKNKRAVWESPDRGIEKFSTRGRKA
jgi:biofilm PGA synthesis N-glycosyltransferase PgaC